MKIMKEENKQDFSMYVILLAIFGHFIITSLAIMFVNFIENF